ncbi:hypothetical protein GGI03_008365 [Coemansia sp. RSA 2337]|nr:hypothetical protein GGI14_002311 [Coemansia sp. S680]KAJ2054761.1 hypothetical protein GGI08_004427 [Coemansia sp. S2]KAJ2409876.1 hypothetical protein GGF41_006538 [Coemansia sp. RSA 2531]KAJ2441559.1 hypothetical protein GGI03_008365 [Coemansia sp. RSA 2337]
MDTETSYWDQYDAYDMEQSLPVTQPPPQLAPQVDEFRYAPYLSSCSVSSQDSYWSRHLGTRPTGTNQQCTPGGPDSLRQTPQQTHSSSNLRRLLVVPDKLATLSLDCAGFDINASGNSSDSGCDVNDYNVQIVAGSAAEGDDATLVVVTAVTPPPSMELPPNGVKSSSHERNDMCRGVVQTRQPKPDAAASFGRSQSDKCCADGSGPKNDTHVANPVLTDHSPPSSPGLCFAGVNANALITRLNFLKDQMDQDELLMSLVV